MLVKRAWHSYASIIQHYWAVFCWWWWRWFFVCLFVFEQYFLAVDISFLSYLSFLNFPSLLVFYFSTAFVVYLLTSMYAIFSTCNFEFNRVHWVSEKVMFPKTQPYRQNFWYLFHILFVCLFIYVMQLRPIKFWIQCMISLEWSLRIILWLISLEAMILFAFIGISVE